MVSTGPWRECPLSAKAVSVKSATDTAIKYEVNIQYSEQHQQPYFGYWDEEGRRHIVWFEDARARAAKCQLVIDYQLLGIGAWQLGLNFPQSSYLILHFSGTEELFSFEFML